jgi:trk system potassium uptake protein TrkH
MVLGASNFFIIAGLFKKRFKDFFTSEFSVFLVMAIIAISITAIFFGLSAGDAVFHIVSAMTTTGFSYVSVAQFSDGFKFFLVFLMLVGGASFSSAGGIKIYRFVLMIRAVRKAVYESITDREYTIKLFGREYTDATIIQAAVVVFLMIALVFFSAFIVSSYGFQPVDALFETTSAVATTGLSTGIISPSLALELKWLFVFLMILGRVEIFAFFIMFSRTKEPTIQNKAKVITMTENAIETNQITKQFKCPNCGNILTYVGLPGENLTITCSSCGTKGQVTIQGITQK